MNNITEMKQLISQIKDADKAYFVEDKPIMTDREYDSLVEKLKNLEQVTGIVFSDSPTRNVGGGVKKELEKVTHTKPMLSVAKTKNIIDVERFAEGREVVVSWKLDGFTLVLRYDKGKFVQAITRGSDGIVGEDVTKAVQYMRGVPQKVICRDAFEVRGEGLISWADMAYLDKNHTDSSHPRNVASGAVRALTPDKGKCSHLDFMAFELIKEEDDFDTKIDQLAFLTSNGFNVVQHTLVGALDSEELRKTLDSFNAEDYLYPVDGLIVEYNDIAYGRSLGSTSHHENRMIALKWKDELYTTVFRGVELATTRSGVVSLTAFFDPVNIDGSMVKRANLFNLGYFENLKLGVGDTITVYKANMIIPQIAENLTQSNSYELPTTCPSCGEKIITRTTKGGIRELFCPNDACIARNAQKIARFCDKAAMNINGLSAVTLEKLMENGWIRSFVDLYHIEDHREDIENARDFGPVMYKKLKDSIEESRVTNLEHFLVAMSIPLMGPQSARQLNIYYSGSWEKFEDDVKSNFNFNQIEGISPMLSMNIHKWYKNPNEEKLWRPVLDEITMTRGFCSEARGNGKSKGFTGFGGKSVVITGSITGMTRKQMTEVLTLMGASVGDSVSRNTDYLIVGANPGGKKLGAAMQNGTRIIPESDFIKMLKTE